MNEHPHSPEPWSWDEEDGTIESSTGGAIADMHPHGNVNTITRLGETFSRSDCRRIVLCVNACAGIPNASLEEGVVGEIWRRLQACATDAT